MNCRIDNTTDSHKRRLCGERGEAECPKCAQREYKVRHNNVARIVLWNLCENHSLQRVMTWFEQTRKGVVENKIYKIMWDAMIQRYHPIRHRKRKVVVVNKQQRTCMIIDIASPGNNRISANGEEINKQL